MRSLFLKIFLWFWAAMALVGGVLVVFFLLQQSFHPPSSRPLGPPPGRPFGRHRPFTGNPVAFQSRTAAEVFQKQGAKALSEFLAEFERLHGVKPFFFDANGNEVSGHTAPSAAQEVARRALESGEVEFQGTWTGLLVAASASGEDGARFALVGLHPRRLLGWGLDPAEISIRFLAVLVTAGALCYGLARYLTAPMSKLQKATRQLAAGDLGTRVDRNLQIRQDEFGELGRDFDRMAERIEQLVQAQQRLLGDISHELRSPLARLNVALELARKKAGPEAAGSLDRIEREAERMNELIGHLLQLARLEADATSSSQEDVELASLVREIAADADFEARSRSRSVRVLESPSCQVKGSAAMLSSAIENIVRNAIHHTAEGSSVEVSLSAPAGAPPTARVSVRDYGAGVPENALGELFRPFYRVEDARDRQSGGAGLGLAIAERIVRLHGGSVRARNALGGGLCVEIELPASPLAPAEAAAGD